MNTQQAAEVIGCTRNHVRYLIHAGKIPAEVKQPLGPNGPRFYRVKPSDARNYKARNNNGRGFPRGGKRAGLRGKLIKRGAKS